MKIFLFQESALHEASVIRILAFHLNLLAECTNFGADLRVATVAAPKSFPRAAAISSESSPGPLISALTRRASFQTSNLKPNRLCLRPTIVRRRPKLNREARTRKSNNNNLFCAPRFARSLLTAKMAHFFQFASFIIASQHNASFRTLRLSVCPQEQRFFL